jgi:hypothetical protein
LRLEDVMVIGGAPIVRANVIINIGYYPWYFPIRLYKRFGFLSAKGSDGIIYWRPYSPLTAALSWGLGLLAHT